MHSKSKLKLKLYLNQTSRETSASAFHSLPGKLLIRAFLVLALVLSTSQRRSYAEKTALCSV